MYSCFVGDGGLGFGFLVFLPINIPKGRKSVKVKQKVYSERTILLAFKRKTQGQASCHLSLYLEEGVEKRKEGSQASQ